MTGEKALLLEPGSRVRHRRYGAGTVARARFSSILRVEWDRAPYDPWLSDQIASSEWDLLEVLEQDADVPLEVI